MNGYLWSVAIVLHWVLVSDKEASGGSSWAYSIKRTFFFLGMLAGREGLGYRGNRDSSVPPPDSKRVSINDASPPWRESSSYSTDASDSRNKRDVLRENVVILPLSSTPDTVLAEYMNYYVRGNGERCDVDADNARYSLFLCLTYEWQRQENMSNLFPSVDSLHA